MPKRKLFVNMAIDDVAASRSFFTAIGMSFNEAFCSDDTLGMVIGEDGYAMLMTHERFASFLPPGKAAIEPKGQTEVLLALSCESREEVDQLVATALANGGSPANEPQDHGFMYGHSFCDPSGHVWEVFWMDPAAIPPDPA